MAKNLDYLGDSVTYADLKKRQKNPNALEMEVIAGGMYIAVRKMIKEQFRLVYLDLLERISDDYQIDLDELKEHYPLDIKMIRKKNVDPSVRCLASNKKTSTPCQNARKQGFNYCGIHLRSTKGAEENVDQYQDQDQDQDLMDDEPVVTIIKKNDNINRDNKNEIKFKKRPPKATINNTESSEPLYVLREESEEEKELRRKQKEEYDRDVRNGGTYKIRDDPDAVATTTRRTRVDRADTTTKSANPTKSDSAATTTTRTRRTHNNEIVPETDAVDIELEKIEGVEYIVYGDRIFEHPGDLEDMGIDDLTEMGKKLPDGTYKWYKPRDKKG